ncbi:glutamate--tRNA ligase, partial [archaeon]|nr:glutamate--tRNA ligase [archaeon]
MINMLKDIILKYALENAVKYGGKANPGAVIGKIFSENKKLSKDTKTVIQEVKKVVQEVNSLNREEQKKRFSKYHIKHKKNKSGGKTLPNLQYTKGKVVMRIAPFPSGPLHIGNARPAILNDEYVRKYKGKLLLVIDDTIGSKEKSITEEAYDLIPKGLDWLEVKYDKIIYKSDRLEIYYDYAKKLIDKAYAYVCSCPQNKIRENRRKGVECPCRHQTVEETLKLWELMFESKEGEYVLRIKTGMQDKNPAFRDRILFRISEREHPKVKNKYTVWPLLEFSWAIDDHLLEITHIIRGKELMIESEMEKYIWNIFNWTHPVIMHSGLLQLEGV